MQKIEIEFKNQTLKIYLIVKEKNLENKKETDMKMLKEGLDRFIHL